MDKLVHDIINLYEKHVGYEVKHAGRPGTPGMSMIKYTESDSIEAIM